jgi:hypothetical protein
MRTGQRDMHNTPLKRRLSITYEELETLKKSIKASVLNELQAEAESSSDLDSFKDQILSEIRTELRGLPDSASLRASILGELRSELISGKKDESEDLDRRVKELAGIQDGLVRELLDQKMIIKKLETEVERLSRALGSKQNTESKQNTYSPSPSLPVLEDPLDLPPLSRKPKRNLEFRKEGPSARDRIDFREAPASLPGTKAKVQLKIKEVEPGELDEKEPVETKCEYIIAESGDRRRFRGTLRQSNPVIEAPPGHLFPPRPPVSSRSRSPVKADPVSARPDEDYKCEYIIAEKAPKKQIIDESVDLRDHEDAEIITCSRRDPRAKRD